MDFFLGLDHASEEDLIKVWFDPADISQKTRNRLWAFISVEMNDILDTFYSVIEKSTYRHLLHGVEVALLKHKQINHWRKLFLHPVDKEYEERLKAMHAIHLKKGLKNGQYVASYMFLIGLFQKSILRQASGPKEAYELISAMNSIVTDDIARALSLDVSGDVSYV